jgi:signal transduction histidine kinase
MKPGSDLHLRIFLPFSAGLLLLAILAWWLATSLLASALERRLEQQMEHAGQVLAAGEFPLTRELMIKLGRLLQADIVLLGADGVGPSTLSEEQGALARAVLDEWSRDPSAPARTLTSDGVPYRLFVQALPESRNAPHHTVALLASLADARAAARQAAAWLGAASAACLLILSWVGHRIVRGITTPIGSLADMASRLSAGQRDVRNAVREANEIGVLAQALNGLAERLRDYETEVAAHSRLAAIGETAARIAHEIRNPLTAVNLQLQMLHETVAPAQRPLTQGLLDEVRRLELIVGSTLAFSRPLELVREPVELNRVIEEVLQVFGAQFAHRGIVLEHDLAADMPTQALDANRIKQVLVNLLVNAADELTDGGTVRIDSSVGESETGFGVADSGSGLTHESRVGLFEAGASRKPGGLGLGLPLCREIVQRHGGRIEVADSDLGGAWFRVWLPKVEEMA